MGYSLSYLPAFERDIILAEANLAQFPEKAGKLFCALDQQLRLLADMPKMYPCFEPYPMFRRMVVLDYIVFYTVDEPERTVYLHRVLAGRMDLGRLLGQYE